MRVLENSMVNLELFPGKSGEQVQGDAHAQAQGAANQAQGSAKSAAGAAQEKAQGVQAQAQSQAKGLADNAQERAQGLREQGAQYQQQGSDYVRNTSDAAHQQGQQYVSDTQDAAHAAVKNNLPESAHGYAGQAVNYVGNFATGTVGTLGGAGKDVADTVGNAVCIKCSTTTSAISH